MTPWMKHRLLSGLLVAVGATGCADGASSATSASDPWLLSTAPDAGGKGGDAGFGGVGEVSRTADAGGAEAGHSRTGAPAPGEGSGGIGLKPGGAQDIAFFRMKVAAKQMPKAADLSIEGWLNEHDSVLPPAALDRTVSLHALAALLQETPGGTTDAVLQLGLNSARTLADVTGKVALTLVIDRSGSMSGSKMANVRMGLHELLLRLPKNATVGLVSFGTGASTDVAMQTVDPAHKATLDKAIDALQPAGGTNLHGGLALGLEQCKKASADSKFRRILLLSDGVPTQGEVGKAAIEGLATAAATAGCSVSTVGVGQDFDPLLMQHVAQKGNGTAWFVQDAAHARQVFVNDLETLLLPVAEKLTLSLKLAAGWKVTEIFGFDWVDKNGAVELTGSKNDAAIPANPDQPPPDNGENVALPTLYASKRNGMVMVQLQAPAGTDLSKAKDLLVATVHYGYTLAGEKTPEKFAVPVQVPGLVDVPDEGLQYFTSPTVRRSWLLLRTGLDLVAACKLAEANQAQAAKALLDAAVQRLDSHGALVPKADWLAVDATQPDLADARALLLAVAALVGK